LLFNLYDVRLLQQNTYTNHLKTSTPNTNPRGSCPAEQSPNASKRICTGRIKQKKWPFFHISAEWHARRRAVGCTVLYLILPSCAHIPQRYLSRFISPSCAPDDPKVIRFPMRPREIAREPIPLSLIQSSQSRIGRPGQKDQRYFPLQYSSVVVMTTGFSRWGLRWSGRNGIFSSKSLLRDGGDTNTHLQKSSLPLSLLSPKHKNTWVPPGATTFYCTTFLSAAGFGRKRASGQKTQRWSGALKPKHAWPETKTDVVSRDKSGREGRKKNMHLQ